MRRTIDVVIPIADAMVPYPSPLWRISITAAAWVRDPNVFIDRGRQMPEGPPLLKERRYLRKDAAEQLWKSLQTQGWKKTRPLWGATAEP